MIFEKPVYISTGLAGKINTQNFYNTQSPACPHDIGGYVILSKSRGINDFFFSHLFCKPILGRNV